MQAMLSPTTASDAAERPEVPAVVVSVKLDFTPAQMQQILTQVAQEKAAVLTEWLTHDEAADYLKISKRTLQRNREKWGLPQSELSEGHKLFFRGDLEALLRAHLVSDGTVKVIKFPSLAGGVAKGAA